MLLSEIAQNLFVPKEEFEKHVENNFAFTEKDVVLEVDSFHGYFFLIRGYECIYAFLYLDEDSEIDIMTYNLIKEDMLKGRVEYIKLYANPERVSDNESRGFSSEKIVEDNNV